MGEDEQVEYKYVICDSEGRATRWEERANRSFKLKDLPISGSALAEASVSVLTLVEAFNSSDLPQWHDENSGRLLRMPSLGRQESAPRQASTASELFAPTRRTSSSQHLADEPSVQSFRSCSRSNLGAILSEVEPEITGHSSGGMDPEVAGRLSEAGDVTSTTALVREESCSNLFLGDDADEDLPVETSEFDDRYVLTGNGPLGEGTFGLVWRCVPKPGSDAVASETSPSQERAAKIVRKARLQPRETRYLLGEDGEIQTHLTMKHKHIVELFEFFDEANTVTLVLEYCRGGDLFDAVTSAAGQPHCGGHGRGFSERAAAVVTRHLLSALSYIHEANIVHRDIKCENVLLLFPSVRSCATTGVPVEENIYKLCDFGFAAHDRGEGLTDRLGSPDTVAPDVLSGRYSTPADIWSAGVLIYMMLSAMPPFTGNTDREVLAKVQKGTYSLVGDPWDGLTAAPKEMIRSMMTVDPGQRVTADQALAAEWLTGPP